MQDREKKDFPLAAGTISVCANGPDRSAELVAQKNGKLVFVCRYLPDGGASELETLVKAIAGYFHAGAGKEFSAACRKVVE